MSTAMTMQEQQIQPGATEVSSSTDALVTKEDFPLKFCTVCASNQNRLVIRLPTYFLQMDGQSVGKKEGIAGEAVVDEDGMILSAPITGIPLCPCRAAASALAAFQSACRTWLDPNCFCCFCCCSTLLSVVEGLKPQISYLRFISCVHRLLPITGASPVIRYPSRAYYAR